MAVSVAQSGKRVLLVDCDMRKPMVHRLFGVDSRRGLSQVIIGEIELADAVRQSSVPNLWVLPAGPQPPNPSELLTLPRFEQFLKSVREQYDLVVVDTPPLLAVSDPSVVAPRVDGVLLTMRIRKNGRPEALRAKEILDGLGVDVFGIVINGVDQNRNYGMTGRYGYGYGYADGYGYTDDGDTAAEDGRESEDARQ